MTEMDPADARAFWKALTDNASALISDADALLGIGSFGRARSLTILAQEELGKALWIYDVFSTPWSTGDSTPREVDALARHGRDHVRKYLEATKFGDELALFRGHYEVLELSDGESREDAQQRRETELDAAAREANRLKQGGFYVDRSSQGVVASPTEISADGIADDLQLAAQVVEMLLIQDHTRMKHEATTEYDSTHAQQFRLLPISHPDDWAAAFSGADEE